MRVSHILIVQDDPVRIPHMLEALGPAAAHVRVACSSDEVARACARGTPELVIVNLLHPRSHQTPLLEALRTALPSHVPVVMLSATVFHDLATLSAATLRLHVQTHPPLEVIVETLLAWSLRSAAALLPAAFPDDPRSRFRVHVQQYITEHLHDATLTVQRAARELGYSRTVLQKQMHRTFGLPFKRHLVNRRLHYARSIFDRGETSVIQCSLAAGFNSHNAFTAAFRRHFGMSPRQYVQSGCPLREGSDL